MVVVVMHTWGSRMYSGATTPATLKNTMLSIVVEVVEVSVMAHECHDGTSLKRLLQQ
jgi:hypothetical protein